MNLASLRIHAGHDVLDHAVFAGSIHGLKNQQNRPFVLGVKDVLQIGQCLDAGRQRLLRAWLVLGRKAQCVAGIKIPEFEVLSIRDSKWL